MSIPVLICDDSALARKQMARALPEEWDVEVQFASNGEQALERIRQGQAHVLFLDLNMPGMSGYEVLDIIRREDLPTSVVVVSGDIQDEARARVLKSGALDFVSKPLQAEQLRETLKQYGLLDASNAATTDRRSAADCTADSPVGFHEALREVVNIAMGQAGGRLGETLNAFIGMPIPRLHQCSYGELNTRLDCGQQARLSGVAQGFGSLGIAGEAILIMNQLDLERVAQRAHPASSLQALPSSTLIDYCSLLAGSCLIGISEQLDLQFNHTAPVLLGEHSTLPELLGSQAAGRQVLAVEISYRLMEDAQCHLILLFTEDSLPVLRQRITMLEQDRNTAGTGT